MNTSDNKTDFLIIGQGLAGSLLSWRLLERNRSVHLLDNHHQGSASMVAAGLFNPVIGKRLSISDQAQQQINHALDFYQKLGDYFNETFFHPVDMLRLFKDQQQAQAFHQIPSASAFFRESYTHDVSLTPFKNDHGAVTQQQTGYLDTVKLLSALKNNFLKKHCLTQTRFKYADLQIMDNGIIWQGRLYDQVIFCEGHQMLQNPWFEWLPLQPAKGDILTIHCENRITDKIINKGHWLLPVNDNTYKTGAPSYWRFIDHEPQNDKANLVCQHFEALFEVPPAYQVSHHQAGIRPTTRDKQAFIGKHPVYHNLNVFNGFGARGSMLIPFYSQMMCDFLLNRASLDNQVDIQRYWCS